MASGPPTVPNDLQTTSAPTNAHSLQNGNYQDPWANRYRGATVADLDPPPALSIHPDSTISWALMSGLERDYTHLTVISSATRALVGYISIPRLQQLLKDGTVRESDTVEKAMLRFRRKGRHYKVITLETELEDLEAFFEGKTAAGEGGQGEKQEFAVVTDGSRKFVLGVATKSDLESFMKRRA